MRIRIEDRVYVGSPIEIVERLRILDHGFPRTVDEYMLSYMKRCPAWLRFEVSGATEAQRCDSFVRGLVKTKMAHTDDLSL